MITQAKLLELYQYEDGNLYRRTKDSTKPLAYAVDGKVYKLPRLVFLYHNGYLPKEHIHHINGQITDNRIENLMPLTKPTTLTKECLQEIVSYHDGNLYWKKPLSGRTLVGDVVGCQSSTGYKLVRIGNRLTKLHHLIFLYHHGYMPKMVDHINGNPTDNRIENLRECNTYENARNCDKKGSTTTSQYKGVSWKSCHKKWKASITVNYKTVFLGYSDNEYDAAKAYNTAAKLYFGEFARCNSI